MYFSSNIKFLRRRKRLVQDDLANALNMKRSTLSGYENNVANPSIENLIAFSDYFNIAIDTLIRVNIAELSESQLTELDNGFDVYLKGGKIRVLATTVDSHNIENIELVPEKAKAGYQRGFADPEYIGELPVFQLPFLSKERKYRSFQISGDSMLPIPDGSWITAEFLIDWNNITEGKAYIILTLDEGIVFKIIQTFNKEKKQIELKSLNAAYKNYIIPLKDVREIWSFTNYISTEMPDAAKPEDELFRLLNTLKADVEKVKTKLDV